MRLKHIIGTVACGFLLLGALPAVASELPADSEKTKLTPAEQRKFDYFFYEGLNLKAAGNYDAAYDAFNHCLAIDSTASALLFELSSFYIQLDQLERSLDMLRQAVANDPSNFTYQHALATMYRNLGMFGESAEAYEKLVAMNPGKPELNYYLAESLTQKGDIDKAIDAYDAMESIIGMNESLSMMKYRLYNSIEESDKAYQEIEKLMQKYPMEARYPMILGDLYLEQNDTVQALNFFNKAHELDPESPYYIVSMANYYDATGNKEAAEEQIHNALTNEKLDVETKVNILSRYIMKLQQTQKGTESANALFQTLLEQHPEDIELKQMYGSLLLLQGKNEDARFQFQLITEMEPQDVVAWQQLLSIALKAEDLEEIIRICNRCEELFPEAPEFYFYKGIALYQQEKYQEALDTYYKALTIIPDENPTMKSDFYGQIGDIYYQMGNMPETYKAYDEALKYNDKNIMVLNNYAYFLSLDKKDLKKAERMSAQTVKMDPNNSTYLDTYAWIFFVQGNYTLARIYIESALKNDTTDSSELLDHYGDILYMLGDKEKAVEQWEKAKALGKDSDILDKKIAEGIYVEEVQNEENE